jgi:uncharacterized protein YndB with AHSA1/START domain
MKPKLPTTIKAEPGKQELFIYREFDAPRELVFKAFTDPKLYIKWIGPDDLVMTIHKFEPRDGGAWKYTHADKNGNKYDFHGYFHEVIAPERMTQTFEFAGFPGHISLETVTFEVLPGERTQLAIHSVYQSVADRDGMVQSGMETGITQGFAKLDAILAKGIVSV